MLTEAWQRAGQATTFIEVPGLRTAAGRLGRRLRGESWPSVVSPWPSYPARTWTALSKPRLEQAIARRAEALRRRLDASLDWSQTVALVISPVWAPWLAALPFRAVIYDCIDDLTVHVPHPRLQPLYAAWEAELISRASAAVVSAEVLADGLRLRRPELAVATIRNGVNCSDFQPRGGAARRPRDLPDRGRPLVGFVGALYQWLDWELVTEVAGQLREFDFVFVGPKAAGSRLPRGDNLFYTGSKAYAAVPDYIEAFDVCWVPFKRSPVSRAANPVKIYEYLAMGKPVVSTAIADPERFADRVVFAEQASDVATALARARERSGSPELAGIAYAQANSWDQRASQYVEFVAKGWN